MEYPSYIEPQKTINQIEGAGFFVRAVAKIIDLVIHGVAGAGLGFAVGLALGLLSVSSNGAIPSEIDTENVSLNLLSSVFSSIGFLMYGAISEAYYGATIGKLLLGIHVIDKTGGPVSFGSALIRGMGYWLDQILFGLVGYLVMKSSPLNQRLGDQWAGTVVMKRSDLNSADIPGGCMGVVVLLVALAFDAMLQIVPVLFGMY